MQDIFDAIKAITDTTPKDLPPLDTIYVVGTGPNGLEQVSRIPHIATVIGVNKAILYNEGTTGDSIPMWMWLCGDTTLPEQEWFCKQAWQVIKCDFSLYNRLNPTACFGKAVDEDISLHTKFPDVPYTFKLAVHLKKMPPYQPMRGGLRGGASIGSQAVQLAYLLGAKKIVLCGIDMMGDTYFDGTVNKVKHMFEDGTSRHLPLFNGLCRWVIGTGVEVVSLSETALDVPVI